MTFTVHQAIYGDKSGAFALLRTSLAETEYARRICNVTDVHDRPSTGHLTQTIFRGFSFNDSYLFIKSFPDISPGVRSGRVLSHALIVSQSDLHKLNDLRQIFDHFLPRPDKDSELSIITLDNGTPDVAPIARSVSREGAAINGLLDHSSHENTIVWMGENGYFSFLICLWSGLNERLRAKLKLGVGFNPQKVDTRSINILYVMEEYEVKWRSRNYHIVGKEDRGALMSMSSLLLCGYRDESRPLRDLIDTYGIVPAAPDDYCYLERVIDTYKNLSATIDFKSLIVFCDLISTFSPEPATAKAQKHILLKRVLSRIGSASADEVLALRNVRWKGFADATILLGHKIAKWVTQSLFCGEMDGSTTNLIMSAFEVGDDSSWWKTMILHGVRRTLNAWEPKYASVLWVWFSHNPEIVDLLDEFIPKMAHVENDFVTHWQKPQKELATVLQAFTKKRGWLILHGLSILQLYDAEESIINQLEIDTDSCHLFALRKMSESIGDEEFVRVAATLGEERLMIIAGERVANSSQLLGKLDVGNRSWRKIWLNSIKRNNRPWDGIPKPKEVLFALFEHLLNKDEIDPNLLLALSNSDHNDLATFTRRAEVWSQLNETTRSGFLRATSLSCVKLLDESSVVVDDLEDDIRSSLTNPAVITKLIRDTRISGSTKILLFEKVPGLKEDEFLLLLENIIASPADSRRLGEIVLKNRFMRATKAIARMIARRSDLKQALIECRSLLGFFERLGLGLSRDLPELVSTDEWWSAMVEQCYKKYPRGPTELGLWDRAGGKVYDLSTQKSGREMWIDAISCIRRGEGTVTIQKVLREMMKDFPACSELKQLKKSYKR